jgi:hypothetical protein
MGKKTNLKSDPASARPHDAGSQISVLQVLVHDQYGTIAYLWPRHWALHMNSALLARDELLASHGTVLALPVGSDDMRSIYDLDLIQRLYQEGCQMVLESVLAVQHFCEEIERGTGTPPSDAELTERLESALSAAGIAIDKKSADYAAFVELLKTRNAIEHPKPSSTYSGDANDWDRVPLAWLISDRSLKAFAKFEELFGDLVDRWQERSATLAQPSTLTVERGLRSTRQHKKSKRT